MRRFTKLAVLSILMLLLAAVPVLAGPGASSCDTTTSTVVPGHCDRDGTVSGHYTLTQGGCDYVVNYRGDFGGDPYLDDGWIFNHIRCDDGGVYQYLIVHETDPRYTGNPDLAIWGTWEFHTYVIGGPEASGNIVRK